MLDGIVAMGEVFRSFALKRIQRLVCTPTVFIRRSNSTSAWTVTRKLKESPLMAAVSNAVVDQNFDYFLVIDFEATCDNQQQLIPQVIIELVSGLFAPRYFRSSERKFPVGTFAPRNESSRELSLLGTNVSENVRSWERMFPETFVSGVVSSFSDHGKGCWRCSESKSKI